MRPPLGENVKNTFCSNLVRIIQHLYDKATSAIVFSGNTGDWYWRGGEAVGVLEHISVKDHDRCIGI